MNFLRKPRVWGQFRPGSKELCTFYYCSGPQRTWVALTCCSMPLVQIGRYQCGGAGRSGRLLCGVSHSPSSTKRLSQLSHLTVQKLRIVVETRRNRPKNRSEPLSASLRVPCRIFWAWFGPALGPNPTRHRSSPAGSSKVFGAL